MIKSQAVRLSKKTAGNLVSRLYATHIPSTATAVVYERHGAYDQVLKKDTQQLPQLAAGQVLVKIMAAPINPADINTIEGNYGDLPKQLPAVAGNEGVGRIVEVGSGATSFAKGQWVIPARPGLGTWRDYLIVDESELMPVSNNIPIEYAATIAVNPCTAYRLLNDFVNLKEGDVIVQNGATSMVGHAVVQMAAQRGIKTISIVRERGDTEEVVDRLKQLGGDIVVTEDYANKQEMRRLISDLPKAKLALNCVGGDTARRTAALLGNKGVMVTYGGMSRKPIQMPTGPFIFNDIALRGFWLTRWVKEHSREERQEMIDRIAEMIQDKKLKLFMESYKFENFESALQAATASTVTTKRKVVLKME